MTRLPFAYAALMLTVPVSQVFAQEYRASISGTITDPTGNRSRCHCDRYRCLEEREIRRKDQ